MAFQAEPVTARKLTKELSALELRPVDARPRDLERRRYPRYLCSAQVHVSYTKGFPRLLVGECFEVCRHGLRLAVAEPIAPGTEIGIRSDSLGLGGRGIVRYYERRNRQYILGIEFTEGLQWYTPHRLSEMTGRTRAVFDALLAGSSASELQESVDRLPEQERLNLFCTACCMESEVSTNCQARADEIRRLLEQNGRSLPPAKCAFYATGLGSCPRTGLPQTGGAQGNWPRESSDVA